MITDRTCVIAHLGHSTAAFKAPMIDNPWFDANGNAAVVVPLGVTPADYPGSLRQLFQITKLHGTRMTMPYKVTATSRSTTQRRPPASPALPTHSSIAQTGVNRR